MLAARQYSVSFRYMLQISVRRQAAASIARTMVTATADEKHVLRKQIKQVLRSLTEEQMREESERELGRLYLPTGPALLLYASLDRHRLQRPS